MLCTASLSEELGKVRVENAVYIMVSLFTYHRKGWVRTYHHSRCLEEHHLFASPAIEQSLSPILGQRMRSFGTPNEGCISQHLSYDF